jgi:hypothetical protein
MEKNKQYWRIRADEYRKCLYLLEHNSDKNNIVYLEQFIHKYDDLSNEHVTLLLAKSYRFKNDKAVSLINIYICENNNVNISKYDIFEQFWKLDCLEQAKKYKENEIGYFGLFCDYWYYIYYDKYNYLFQ